MQWGGGRLAFCPGRPPDPAAGERNEMRNGMQAILDSEQNVTFFQHRARGALFAAALVFISFLPPGAVAEGSACSDAEVVGGSDRVFYEMGASQFRKTYELNAAYGGVLVIEAGALGLAGSAPDVTFYDGSCRPMKAAKAGFSGTSSVAFLPVVQGGRVFLSIEQGSAEAGEGSFWLQSTLLSRGSGLEYAWSGVGAAGDCEATDDRRALDRFSTLTLPGLEESVDEGEVEVMPSTGTPFPGAGGSLEMVSARGLNDPVDEGEMEVMPLETDEPVLLRVHSEAGLGLIALEAGDRCSATGWPARSVLVDPSREFLAYLQPGQYRLRSLRPVGAGWTNPAVEVFSLTGASAAASGGV